MELYWLWLSMLPGVGPLLQKRLLEKFGSPADIYHAGEGELRSIEGLGVKRARCLLEQRSLARAERVLEAMQRIGARLLLLNDPLYPPMVRRLPKAPMLLYYRGMLRQESCGVGIVGARRCTAYGKAVARQAAVFLAQQGVPVISGMARGIDSYANTACLQAGGYTLAFLGHGVDICFPAEHQKLMDAIVEHGAVLSAYPPGTEVRPEFFPQRNYLISAWSYSLLVVEAARKSGSLITAGLALEMGRPVFAVPGSIYSRESEGTNALIAAGTASIYIHPRQLLPLPPTGNPEIKGEGDQPIAQKAKDASETTETANGMDRLLGTPAREILQILVNAAAPMGTGELAARFSGDKKIFWEVLALLILQGKVENLPGGRVQVTQGGGFSVL
ncbi:MAG TPA: DNA-protecting protein DprA [Firmicutes bacterium]|nr:DNA-protecting protein DprA [Bacillota bacterium]